MKNYLRVLGLVVVVAAMAMAQTAAPAPVPVALPSTWGVSVGLEMTAYNTPVQFVPTVSVMGCWTHVCEISTLEMAPTIATVRQEIAYKASESSDKQRMLLVLVGGGLTAAQGAAGSILPTTLNLGNVGGGFAYVQDLGQFIKALKGAGVKVKISARESAVTSLGVKPQYQAELVYRFK